MTRLDRCCKFANVRVVAHRHLPEGVSEFVDRGAENAALAVENGADGIVVSNYDGRISDGPANE